jgi:solute carrier family 29 (equilibrative nucleoside transporter), member 1/2/3
MNNDQVRIQNNEMDGIFRIIQDNNTNVTATVLTTYDVWKIIESPVLCIFITFLITLSFFPGFTSQLSSIHQCTNKSSRFYNDLYVPTTFLIFNIGDLMGRIMASYIPSSCFLRNRIGLVRLSYLRLIFVPLFLLCNTIVTSSGELLFLPQIASDIYSLMIQILFAVTNGLLLSLSFMIAPQLLPLYTRDTNRINNDHNERCMSEMLNLSVSLGLLSGSLCSYWIMSWYR